MNLSIQDAARLGCSSTYRDTQYLGPGRQGVMLLAVTTTARGRIGRNRGAPLELVTCERARSGELLSKAKQAQPVFGGGLARGQFLQRSDIVLEQTDAIQQ